MNFLCGAIAIESGTKPRLVFTGYVWKDWGDSITFCIHGEKLRWTCDWCDEHFAKNPHHLPDKAKT